MFAWSGYPKSGVRLPRGQERAEGGELWERGASSKDRLARCARITVVVLRRFLALLALLLLVASAEWPSS